MSGRKNLVAIGPEAPSETPSPATADTDAAGTPGDAAQDEMLLTDYYEDTFEESARRSFAWLAPALAVAATVGWTAFFVQAHVEQMIRPAPLAQWSEWIVDWSVPVALIVLLWLLAMRTSRREAGRFADAAQALSAESAELESRLIVVNRELSLAREFIAAQSRDLESLGRMAAERLSRHADHLQNLIQSNGEQVGSIEKVSNRAVENMDRLRDGLPVIANSARDVANQIGQAGNVAKDQIDGLNSEFSRLNEISQSSGVQVDALRLRVNETISALSEQVARIQHSAQDHFTQLAEHSGALRQELEAHEEETFAAMRARTEALQDELAQRREALALEEQQAMEAMRQRIAGLQEHGAALTGQLREGEREASAAWSNAVAELEAQMTTAIAKVADVDRQAMDSARARLEALAQEAERVDRAMAERNTVFDRHVEMRAAQLAGREAAALEAMEERLAAFDDQMLERQEEQMSHVETLAERGEALAARLAEIDSQMQGLVEQSGRTEHEIAQAAENLAGRLSESQSLIEQSSTQLSSLTNDSVRLLEIIRSGAEHTREGLPDAIGEAEKRLAAFVDKARDINELIGAAQDKGLALTQQVELTQESGSAALDQLTQLGSRLADISAASQSLAAHARDELTSAIALLEQSSASALSRIGEQNAETIREIAGRIGSESSDAIDAALREHTAKAIAELNESAVRAGETGREVAVQLRDQLAIVNELAGNLEHRVAYARQRAEDQVDHDFSRRMALITESLNSSAIDISKVFETELTDTAWSGYLKGDRGIFTRRAVRLLQSQEARAIAELYQSDDAFRETVSRYIHDFEAMLRSILSTRDGHALAVTLLSSDMGKLYVALAQAIERLRN